MISLVRISGSEKDRSRAALKASTRGQRGLVVKPGRWLWATSSGAARKGLAHPVKNSDDPLLEVCRLSGLSTDHDLTVKPYDPGVRYRVIPSRFSLVTRS